ncbi:MAG: hypothetical protein VZS44_11285 [Bacilli bacterium]|nr:hypothetical protein [Bacilli bacterium]
MDKEREKYVKELLEKIKYEKDEAIKEANIRYEDRYEKIINNEPVFLDMNGEELRVGDKIIYHHIKKELLPDDENTERVKHGVDEETGQPLTYQPVKEIKYKGQVVVDYYGRYEIKLPHPFHWHKWFERIRLVPRKRIFITKLNRVEKVKK